MSTEALVQGGRRLREARESLGLSQSAVGLQVGVAQAAVARWEAGLREPALSHRQRLAAVLGADPYAIDVAGPAEGAA